MLGDINDLNRHKNNTNNTNKDDADPKYEKARLEDKLQRLRRVEEDVDDDLFENVPV